jgi:phage shock protein E
VLHQSKRSLSIVLFIGVVLLGVVGCAPAAAPSPTTSPTLESTVAPANVSSSSPALPDTLSVTETAAKRDVGAFILDVRTPDEWKQVHIPGANLIPLDQLPNRVSEVPKDKEVVVVCHSGNRSKQGRDILKQAGYTQVTSMAGGMNAWQAANLPTATGQ